MNSIWNSFFKEERKQVFEPGPFFTQRVMARLSERVVPGVWEMVPRATGPVLALALVLLFAVLGIQILIPVEPERGAIEAYVGQDLTPSERMLIIGQQVPASIQFEEWTLLEPTP
jgi:hypothetical protein